MGQESSALISFTIASFGFLMFRDTPSAHNKVSGIILVFFMKKAKVGVSQVI